MKRSINTIFSMTVHNTNGSVTLLRPSNMHDERNNNPF